MKDFRVVAILAAYNEEDIIAQVVTHLIEQGVLVYFLDNESTDGTVKAVKPFLGKGLLKIERFSGTAAPDEVHSGGFAWESILRRKEELARELDADWFIHHDADEFRESVWPGRTLRDSIQAVDRFGYNAIDFAVFNFWPTHDHFGPHDDVRSAFRHYERGQVFDRVQVKCWKKTPASVELASTGGHDAAFEGRRVFPIRFILRHYPIRGQEHGRRKVLVDRRPRFLPDERARGWHVQYDGIAEGHNFLRDAATLTAYDPEAIRLDLVLNHRTVEYLEQLVESERARLNESLDLHVQEIRRLGAERDERTQELTAARNEGARLTESLDLHVQEIRRLGAERDERTRDLEAARNVGVRLTESLDLHVQEIRRLGAERDERTRELEVARNESVRLTESLDLHVQEIRRLGAERDEQIRELEALRSDRDAQRLEVAGLRAHLTESERVAGERVAALSGELEALRVALANSQDAMNANVSELRAVYASRSWRVTVPLRWVYDRLLG